MGGRRAVTGSLVAGGRARGATAARAGDAGAVHAGAAARLAGRRRHVRRRAPRLAPRRHQLRPGGGLVSAPSLAAADVVRNRRHRRIAVHRRIQIPPAIWRRSSFHLAGGGGRSTLRLRTVSTRGRIWPIDPRFTVNIAGPAASARHS